MSSRRCKADRRLELVFVTPDGKVVTDVDRSSRSGAWALESVIPEDATAGRIVVLRKDVGRDTCGKDSLSLG